MHATIVGTLRRYNSKRVLDIGCGNGALAHLLSQDNFDVTGIDPDEKGIQLAMTGSGHFIRASCYDDPEELGLVRFDAVTCLEVIEHLYSPDSALRFAYKALKTNGVLILSTPYHGYVKNLAISILNRWDRHWNPLREGGHIKFFSKATSRKLLERNKFQIEKSYGFGRVPFLWKSVIFIAKKK
ncbi:MAG: class I SAM-dependent methyltransferase [Candidatus Hadarchaeum sp.]